MQVSGKIRSQSSRDFSFAVPGDNNESQVWERFRKGDEDAFICIYKKYFKSLINFGLQFCAHKSDAEDFVQDLFIDLRSKRPQLPQLKSSLKLFLLASLKNRIIDYKRKEQTRQKRINRYYEEFTLTSTNENQSIISWEKDKKIKKLKIALDNLTSRQREAIYYFYYENLSYPEIAELMNLNNVKSSRNLIYKAFRLIRENFRMH